jgi:serine phosphatase RsbU (regulator of sigma subunit)
MGLGAGESLVLYSDGITGAQDPAGDEYQEARLIRYSEPIQATRTWRS